jgi:hypothetical protein
MVAELPRNSFRREHSLELPHLISWRLREGQPTLAVKLLKFLSTDDAWQSDEGAKVCFVSLSEVVNHLISSKYVKEHMTLVREAFPTFAWHICEVPHHEYTVWHSRIEALQRR